jgi:hypothetical protein
MDQFSDANFRREETPCGFKDQVAQFLCRAHRATNRLSNCSAVFRHRLIGSGVELFGVILLLLNCLDELYRLAKLDWHVAYQIVMSLCYVVLSVRLVQLILAFRGE